VIGGFPGRQTPCGESSRRRLLASVRHADSNFALGIARFGLIDRSDQIKIRSARRSDTPRSIRPERENVQYSATWTGRTCRCCSSLSAPPRRAARFLSFSWDRPAACGGAALVRVPPARASLMMRDLRPLARAWVNRTSQPRGRCRHLELSPRTTMVASVSPQRKRAAGHDHKGWCRADRRRSASCWADRTVTGCRPRAGHRQG
jgi:hypothetical protein